MSGYRVILLFITKVEWSDMDKAQRTHDSFYLKENRYEESKQLHHDIVDLIKKQEIGVNDIHSKVILDAGCAAGEFAYLLRKVFPFNEIKAFDLLPELIAKAKEKVQNVDFFIGNILDVDLIAPESIDILTCTGVLSIFDKFEDFISNLLVWVKPGGAVYLHSLFSDYPVDVQVRYNLSENYGSGILELGWNIFSKDSVSTYLSTQREVESFNFHDFSIKVELKKQEDIVRSWTFKDENGNIILTNSLMLLQPHSILEIRKVKLKT